MLALLALSTVVLSQTLIWSDEFDSFDLSKWEHEITAGGGGNWEFEYYTNNRTNSYTRGGILYLKPTLTADTIGYNELANGGSLELWGGDPANLCTSNQWYGCERAAGGGGNVLNPIQSARIRSVSSFNFKYGRIEIRAKLPRGDWIWPALWMLPRRNAYGDWPASGEIDIVESRGNDASYSAGGCNVFGTTLHWGPYWGQDAYLKTHQTYTLSGGDFSTDFHVFGASWDATGYYTYLDSQSNVILSVNFTQMDFWSRGGWGTMFANPWVGATNAAPFDQEFFIIFNLAVGGTNGYFPDGVGGKPWKDADPNAVNAFWNARGDWYPTWQGENAALQVDYVRVYSS